MTGPEHSAVRLSKVEQAVWRAVLQAETREDGRRMLEIWAGYADGGNAPLLDGVFKLMWRRTDGEG